jgi:protein SCO1/2
VTGLALTARARSAGTRPALALGLALAALGGGVAHADKQIVFPQGSEQPLAALQDVDVIEHLGERVPTSLRFKDPDGRGVAISDLLGRGKPVLVTLRYHRCPMLCSLVLDAAAKAMKGTGLLLGRDLLAVDISIDPAEDAKLTRQTQQRVVGLFGGAVKTTDWPFWLSDGDQGAAARALADAVGFKYKYDEQSRQFAHEAVSFVLTPDGTIARYLYGVDYLTRDFRLAVVEAGGGRVGTSFDKVILSCYKYDPVTRRYAPFVFGFMRLGAALVFFALAGLLTVLWRKEFAMRKRRAA